MKYLNKFSKFFKKKKEKVPFERSLINLQKFIDSVCPEEINKFKTTRRVSKEFKIIVNNVSVEDKRHPEYRIPSPGLGRIKILLSQDSENYILITLCYNDQMKFDMLTWANSVSISGNMIFGLIIEEISPTGLRVSSGSLFDKIRDYLEDNDLIGQIEDF